MAEHIAKSTITLETFIGRIAAESIPRIAGTAIFFTGRLEHTPPTLQQFLHRTGVLHQDIVLTTVLIEPVPKVDAESRIEISPHEAGFTRLVIRYGYMQGINIPVSYTHLTLPTSDLV